MKKTYTFPSLELNENEMNFLKMAIQCAYDMEADLMFEEIPGAFLGDATEMVITKEDSKEIRRSVNEVVDKMLASKSVADKFNVKVG